MAQQGNPGLLWKAGAVCSFVLMCATMLLAQDNTAPNDLTSASEQAIAADQSRADWPRWRGSNYDGISQQSNWSADWPESGPALVWKAEVGTGFSSVSIVGNKLYTMGSIEEPDSDRDDETKSEEDAAEAKASRTEVIWCLDVSSGDVLWKHSYPCKLFNNLHEGGPACTPTVAGNRVFTVSKEGHFLCLDAATGNLLWQKSIPTVLGVKPPYWGFSCSPLVLGDQVLIEVGRTAAFDVGSGDLNWKSEVFRPGYSSPIPFQTQSNNASQADLIAILNNDFFMLFNAKDGAEKARYKWVTQHPTNAATPIISNDKCFISSGYNKGCALLHLKEGSLELVYKNRDMRNHFNSCILHEGYLYGFDGNTSNRRNITLKCLDFETGEQKWKERGFGSGSLMLAGERLVVLSDDGEVTIVRPSPNKYEELVRRKVLDGRFWTVPVLMNGNLYVRNAEGTLACFDVRGNEPQN